VWFVIGVAVMPNDVDSVRSGYDEMMMMTMMMMILLKNMRRNEV